MSLSQLLSSRLVFSHVGNCSGGQQRRVSFAAAMVHEPELLILDEPTVGLDPLLRERIWQYLVETTSSSKLAVIITTHYIEEARQASCVRLRNARYERFQCFLMYNPFSDWFDAKRNSASRGFAGRHSRAIQLYKSGRCFSQPLPKTWSVRGSRQDHTSVTHDT